MKKLLSSLLVGTASLAAIGASSLSIVSCGSSDDNTSKYMNVLKQAIGQVITDKRTQSANITTTKQHFSMSISDITAKAAAIIKADKLDISTDYFTHLYLFGSFTEDKNQAVKNTVTVTQNSSSRPTSITINYDNKGFAGTSSTSGEPTSSLLGEISIDIKQRHLLVMKKLLTTIDYNLNNTAYFDKTNSKWTDPAAQVSTFKNGFTGLAIAAAGTVKQWLAVSNNPADPTQLIGVATNGIWYSADSGKTWTSSFYQAGIAKGGNTYDRGVTRSSISGFQTTGINAPRPVPNESFQGSIQRYVDIQHASIQWHGSTAYISTTHVPDGQTSYFESNNTSVGDLWVARLGDKGAKVGAKNDLYQVSDKLPVTLAPTILTGKSAIHVGNQQSGGFLANRAFVDKDGNLFWGTSPRVIEDTSLVSYGRVKEETFADITAHASVMNGGNQTNAVPFDGGSGDLVQKASFSSTIQAGRDVPGNTSDKVKAQGATMSPDGKNIWLYGSRGVALHYTIANGKLNPAGTQVTFPGVGNDNTLNMTAVASNTGLYVEIASQATIGDTRAAGGNRAGTMKYIGFKGNDNKLDKIYSKTDKKIQNGYWSYGYMGDSSGKNAYEILSTGSAGATFIINPDNTSGELTPATTGAFAGYVPIGALSNPDNGSHTGQGLVLQPVAIATGKVGSSTYFFPANHSTMDTISDYSNTGALSAVSGNYATMAIGNQVYDVSDVSKATKTMFATSAVGIVPAAVTDSGTAPGITTTFLAAGLTGTSSISLSGLTIKYKGSALTWTAPTKFIN